MNRLQEAIDITIAGGVAGHSYLRRKMKLTHEEADVLIQEMERLGIISEFLADRPREILKTKNENI